MKFSEVVTQTLAWLQREGRVSYRALRLEFDLKDHVLAALKEELIEIKELAVDKDGKMLVWTGTPTATPSRSEERTKAEAPKPRVDLDAEAERRQLTVMFCDLVGSTPLAEKLDPEELRDVILAYQETCAEQIRRFDGYVARYVGDGLLVYFGYPHAHEDDAQRAVRAGLGIVAEVPQLNARLQGALGVLRESPLQVRIGIHTGLVVVSDVGGGDFRDRRAIVGETPNVASRVQGIAEPDTVAISAVTYRLVQGLFECKDRGPQELKGVSHPVTVYCVVRESEAQSRFEVTLRTGLSPLIGREHELGLLQQRWKRAQQGEGQVVLLSGEPGIGKSRLVQELKEQLAHEGVTRIEFRCSPYHQNSALYPIIEHLQRMLEFARGDAPAAKLEKLQHTLSRYRFPQADTVPLMAALLSLPHPESSPPITVSPQRQKEKTQAAVVAWLLEEAKHKTVYNTWEDTHWADPSTLEVLNLIVDQAPTASLYVLLTFRPEFTPPWGNRSHLSQITLSRLGRGQVEAMVECVTGGKALPPEVMQHIVVKTDGVPLFVEELTKTVIEAAVDEGPRRAVPLPLAIPATLQDALMARLDRLGMAKEIAQLGATLGREFSYELLQAVSPLDDETLQDGLRQLVASELVYQHGLLPQAHYLFKHALIQDTAYQSLLKSTRQQHHRRIAQVLVDRFPETVETQPELVAHHYTAAGLIAQAIPYWQQAGQRACQRGANAEAVRHLTAGLELLKTLPDTPARAQQELTLQLTSGALFIATHGYAASEVEYAYYRARELCQQIGAREHLVPALLGMAHYHAMRADHQAARELAEEIFSIAQEAHDPDLLIEAHYVQGNTLEWTGEYRAALTHLEQGIALYDPRRHRSHAVRYGSDPGVACRVHALQVLWLLGYPDQALKRAQELLALVQELSHANSVAYGLIGVAQVHQHRREWPAAQERAEACIAFTTEFGVPYFTAQTSILLGAALAGQGHHEEGIAKMRQGLAAQRDAGGQGLLQYWLAMQLEAYIETGQFEEGWAVLAEGLTIRPKHGDRYWEEEIYRLNGELLLAQTRLAKNNQRRAETETEAETCFQHAIETAREQRTKSLELRAATSLAQLWQKQGKKEEARQMLSEIYGWFTEGFDTADLKDAKALLDQLGRAVRAAGR